ncbi:glycosyltransferase, partial [Abiotrophia defectiva]
MNIVYATSDNFVDILAVSVASLYETNAHLKPRVWILSYGVTEANKAKLDQLASRYGQASIEWLEDMTLPAELQSDRGSLS